VLRRLQALCSLRAAAAERPLLVLGALAAVSRDLDQDARRHAQTGYRACAPRDGSTRARRVRAVQWGAGFDPALWTAAAGVLAVLPARALVVPYPPLRVLWAQLVLVVMVQQGFHQVGCCLKLKESTDALCRELAALAARAAAGTPPDEWAAFLADHVPRLGRQQSFSKALAAAGIWTG